MGSIEIKRFDVVSVGKIMAVVYTVMGFFIGLVIAVSGSFAALAGAGIFAALGVLAIVVMPVFFGIIGFVAGIVMAFVYNIVAERVGDIAFDTK